MSKPEKRTYSRYTLRAMDLFGSLIQSERKLAKKTVREIADRAGISRGLLQRIERGDPSSGIGVYFEVATILGVRLFDDSDESELNKHILRVNDKLSLLPASIRKSQTLIKNDF